MSGNQLKSSGGAGCSNLALGTMPIPSIEEKNKQIQQETLLEKLRAKYRVKPKSYEEIKKSVRMYFIEKHYPLDPLCKAALQSALDKLQHYIKVTSRHGLVERLESLSRQLGLKFVEDRQALFISTDMFYVEILLDVSGTLSDVKVHHECKTEQHSNYSASSKELLNCLRAGDFADFTVQLEGLSSIYQLNAEPKVKKKAFVALQAMETDIYNIYQQQLQQQLNNHSDSYTIMNNSCVGLVLERRGGHPMKLTYFCPPLHLIEAKIKVENVPNSSTTVSREFSIEEVIKSPKALSVTLNLEASSANKLQTMPIVSFTNESGMSLEQPIYEPLNQNNSMLMPATCVLRLSKPMPVCIDSLRALGLAGLTCAPNEELTTVMNLTIQTASRQLINSTQKGLYVNLPKETHCYFFTDNRRLRGTTITSLPFTEPAQVPKIIKFLKRQALFYTLLSSCVREQQKQYNDMDSTVILEVTAVSLNQITVELQHPYEESLATVDFLLEDGQVTCVIYCLNNDYEILSQKLTRTVRQVQSIPMVIYKLLKCWDDEHQQKLHGTIAPGAGAGSGTADGVKSVGGEGVGVGAMHGTNTFGQFTMEAGMGEGGSGVGGGFTSLSNLKIDSKARSLADAFAASTSAAAAIAGLINLKRETAPQQTESSSPCLGSCSGFEANTNEHEIADKYKNIWKDKTPNLKHSVSITPIASDGKSPLQPVDVQRTGSIEIIPLNTQANTSAGATSSTVSPATTITITPITGASKETSKEAKKPVSSGSASKRPHESSSSSSASNSNSTGNISSTASSDALKEKKRKKKRDDSPMGPPEKVYSRQNSPAGSGMSDASAGSGVVRKFSSPSTSSSSSPKAANSGAGAALGLMAGQPSARPSPKHSPVYSSPKHSSSSNTASNSPKSPFGTLSPKHGSSGKPSMSTLKSATAATSLSLSPKAEKTIAGTGSSSGATHSLPLVSSASGLGSVANPPIMRPVPPLASSQFPSALKKDKPMVSSSASGSTSGGVAITVAALKTSQQQQPQQQLKSSVASLSHLAAGGTLGSFGASNASALEINALRKGMAGAGVGQGLGATAGAVSSMTTTTVSTATIQTTAAGTAADSSASALPPVETGLEGVGAGAVPATAIQHQQPQRATPHSSDSTSSSSISNNPTTGAVSGSSTGYMVKPSSQEGLKLTINKTSSGKRENKCGTAGTSSTALSSTSSKKQHTGLKPGVNSGPASKKALSSVASTGSSSSSKNLFQKANSSGNLSNKLSGSSTSSGGLPLTKSNSTNSFQEQSLPKRRPSMCSPGSSSSGPQRKASLSGSGSASGSGLGAGRMSPAALSGSMSQPPPRFDHHTDMMTILQYASPISASMESFIKGLHNKFQIPKLSQRTSSGSGQAGQNAGSTDQTAPTSSATSVATASSSSSISQEQQFNADLGALASSISPSSSSGTGQKPSITSTPGSEPTDSSASERLPTLGSSATIESGDGIDEELLASLAGE